MSKTKGRLTLPSQANFLKETKELIDRWGADAIRDSDGTKLDEATKQLDAKIYTTYFVARNHNEFAEKHMEECQQIYVMSKFHLATSNELEIPFIFHNVAKECWQDIGPAVLRLKPGKYVPLVGGKREKIIPVMGRAKQDIQVPYLEDPNTGEKLFESAAIVSYLQKQYG